MSTISLTIHIWSLVGGVVIGFIAGALLPVLFSGPSAPEGGNYP